MKTSLCQVLLWIAAVMLAGAGCAHSGKNRPPRPPMPPKAGLAAESGDATSDEAKTTDIRLKLNPSKMLQHASEPDDGASATNVPMDLYERVEKEETEEPPRLRLTLDPAVVEAMQLQALDEVSSEEEADIHPKNAFTRWLDGYHKRMFCRMDNAVRRVDTMWLTEDIKPYEYELSTFKLKLLLRAGGRSNDDSSDYKVKFRADFALPGLKRRLHLFLDDTDRDALPGTDPMELGDENRVGARVVRELRHSDLDFGGGVRLHSGKPVAFGDVDWRWKWDKSLGGILNLTPRGYWYSDEGLGQTTTLTWTRWISERRIFQYRASERSTEETHGWEFEQTVRFAWLRSGNTRGLIAQASIFPHYGVEGDFHWDDSLLNLTWRGALYRKWIYYTVTPQVEFPREDDYKPKPSLRIGLEIFIGGKSENLDICIPASD